MRLAITGATGFVGSTLLRLALAEGHPVRALTRRGGTDRPGLTWVPGALDDRASLDALVAGSDAVIHVAGVVNAPDRAGFDAGNVTGTAAILAAAQAAGVSRFVHVSSLSAREPALSDYGASKAGAEALVAESGLDWTIVRPPAIFGPGDREMLDLFRAAKLGMVPLPPGGRLSVIEVSDLARLLLALAAPGVESGKIVEPDDGIAQGWDHRDFARAIGAAVGRRALPLSLPAGVLRAASAIDRAARRGRAKLTADRVRYFCHPDWVVTVRPDPAIWTPRVETRAGLKATADWYRAQGWL
ncbi:NAD(P)H-binding protein [Sphingomonas sp. 1P06PA]|uniref:NAD-dependent epimerase/dehydratase family protein n=1 Tax=Sphingomonas sp. 1P06PA TaxID=554121 RepID=UPI0039A50250